MHHYLSRRSAAAGLALVVAGALLSAAWAHAAAAPERAVTVAVSADNPIVGPRVVLAQHGQQIVFTNHASQDLRLVSTPHDPAQFALTVPSNGTARLTLTKPGTYHYYDANTAHVIDYQAAGDVVHTLPSAPNPDLPDQGWIIVPGRAGVPYDVYINVPAAHDLMAPDAIAVRVGGSVTIHNYDSDAHNLVTDPADPTGAAFELLGTDGEPSIHGAERRITFTKAGLYHVYCSIHAKMVGREGKWQVVIPRDNTATGYADMEPMEAWILVTP